MFQKRMEHNCHCRQSSVLRAAGAATQLVRCNEHLNSLCPHLKIENFKEKQLALCVADNIQGLCVHCPHTLLSLVIVTDGHFDLS